MAAPTKESPFATVILQHDLPDGTTHFDWLLAVQIEDDNALVRGAAGNPPHLKGIVVYVRQPGNGADSHARQAPFGGWQASAPLRCQ